MTIFTRINCKRPSGFFLKEKVTPAQPEQDKWYLIGSIALYISLVFTGILIHPMWRDEIHPWLISRSSSSLTDLLQQKSLEGHPDLWYVIIYGINLLTNVPLYMQIVHGMIAITTAFLILRHAPFARYQRFLLVFGYYFIFEYSVITRNYAIGILLIVLILVLSRHQAKHILLRAILVSLLAQTNVFGLIVGIALVMAWITDVLFNREERSTHINKPAMAAALTLIVAAFAWSVHSIIPPDTSFFSGSADFSHEELTLSEFIRSVGIVWQAWVPVPELSQRFWNTNIIKSELVRFFLSLILLIMAARLFRHRKGILFLFLTGTTGIILFILAFYFGYARHHGHLFILLVVCFWLDRMVPARGIISDKVKRQGNLFLTSLLALHMMVGIAATVIHYKVPFSAGKLAARYIDAHHFNRFLVAGDQDVCLETVAGYLDQEAWFFSRSAISRYLVYDEQRKSHGELRLSLLAGNLLASHRDTILLVMNYPLNTDSAKNLVPLKRFTESIQPDEICYLYLMLPEPVLTGFPLSMPGIQEK